MVLKLSYQEFSCVNVDYSRYATSTMVSGIPQGTILGPLLLTLFINSVSDELLHSKIQLYVDDSKLYGDTISIQQCQAFVRDFLVVDDWLQSWMLRNNLEQCEVLHLECNSLQFSCSMNNKVIPVKDFCRDLGVYKDNTSTFHQHCSNVAHIAHWKNNLFLKAFCCQDHEFYVFLFTLYIGLIVESVTQVWNPRNRYDIDLIENVQLFT